MARRFRYVGPISIEIHDEVLFQPGGDVHNWAAKIRAEQTRNTKNAAPLNRRMNKNPGAPPRGTLKALVSSSLDREGPKILGIITRSDAPYTSYVIKGTRPQYRRDAAGRFGSGFSLPYNAGFTSNRNASIRNFDPTKSTGRTIVQKVSGQPANNFLLKGLQKTSARHPALKGSGSILMQFR